MSLLKGKKGLIMGVANDRSIAWGIAKKLSEHGAELAFTYLGDALKKRVVPLAESLKSNFTLSCDVEKKEDVVKALYNMVDFKPTEAQTPILNSKKRYILVAGGEQAGKSMIASKYLLSRVFETETPGLYWLVAADYERTRAEFEYLVEDFAALGVLKKASKRVDPGRIELADGTVIETKSAKDPRTLAMRAPNGIIGCEASQLDLETFYRIRGRCAPKKAWMFLAGTFEPSFGADRLLSVFQ